MEHLIKVVGNLAENVSKLVHLYANDLEHRSSCHGSSTKHDLQEMEQRIMSAIADFAAKQQAFNDRQSAAVDSIVSSQAGIVGDIANLNEQIVALQNSVGGVTPEDQALIDSLQASGEALTAKVEAQAAALADLDSQTPPKPPTP